MPGRLSARFCRRSLSHIAWPTLRMDGRLLLLPTVSGFQPGLPFLAKSTREHV